VFPSIDGQPRRAGRRDAAAADHAANDPQCL